MNKKIACTVVLNGLLLLQLTLLLLVGCARTENQPASNSTSDEPDSQSTPFDASDEGPTPDESIPLPNGDLYLPKHFTEQDVVEAYERYPEHLSPEDARRVAAERGLSIDGSDWYMLEIQTVYGTVDGYTLVGYVVSGSFDAQYWYELALIKNGRAYSLQQTYDERLVDWNALYQLAEASTAKDHALFRLNLIHPAQSNEP